jgi:hypothetical protein
MRPRRSLLADLIIAATMILAVGMARAAYTRATGGPHIDRGGQATTYAAPPPHPHIACGLTIADECRKLDWWPE